MGAIKYKFELVGNFIKLSEFNTNQPFYYIAVNTVSLMKLSETQFQFNAMGENISERITWTDVLLPDNTLYANIDLFLNALSTATTIPIGGGGGGGNYTGASPTTVTVGGLTAGSAIAGLPISDILEDILVPYIAPAFTAFAISGQATSVEVGSTVSGTKTFTWSISTPANVQANSVAIRDVTNATDLATGLANDGSEALGIGIITNNIVASHTWQARATNTQLALFNSSLFTVNWLYQIFYGDSAAAPNDSATVRALPSSRFTNAGNTFNLNTGTTNIIFTVAIPATMTLVSVIDLDALNANITGNYILTTFNVNDAGGNPVSYKVYTMTIAVPYAINHRHQITVA